MLAENPKIIDLDVHQIKNSLTLFEIKKTKPLILILYEGDKILKIIDTEKGVIERDDNKFAGRKTLKSLYTPEIQNVIAVDRNFLKESPSLFAKKVNYDEDFLRQVFRGWEITKDELGKRIHIYPETIYKFKFIKHGMVRLFLNLLYPKNGIIMFVLFKEKEIFASLIIGIKNREIDLITTTENLEDKLKDIEGLKDYKKIVKISSEEYKVPVWGVFQEFSGKKTIIYPFNLRWKIIFSILKILGGKSEK